MKEATTLRTLANPQVATSGHLHPSGDVGAFGEPRLHDGFGGLKRYAIRSKWYRCRERGHKFQTETNHYTEIYTCPQCGPRGSTSDCIELELSTQLKRLEAST